MKVAIVHDWLVSARGGEKVLESIARIYPEAPIHTLFYEKNQVSQFFHSRNIVVPRGLNMLRRFRKLMLPILPSMIERMELDRCELVISSSSCVAKGVVPPPGAKHICYLHSPMRYIWDQRLHYLGGYSGVPGLALLLGLAASRLRIWDITSATRVDNFLVNSNFVKQRVEKYYRRDAELVYPPVDVKAFAYDPVLDGRRSEDYYLVAGAFVSYKRFDLAIAACEKLGRRLIVAGSGPMARSLQKLSSRYVQVVVAPSDAELRSLVIGARALIFPGVEDFGIIAVEALAAGTPVIAFRGGGACDFVVEAENGIFFSEASRESLSASISTFEQMSLDRAVISESAEAFSQHNFQDNMKAKIQRIMGG